MSDLLLIGVGAVALALVVVKGFHTLVRRWRTGPQNNWMNEAYAARQEAGSWAENELAPGSGPHTAPPSIGGFGL